MKTKKDSFDDRVRAFLSRHETSPTFPPGVGLGVSVVESGDVLFQGTYGLRERDRDLPVTPRTIFDIDRKSTRLNSSHT